MTSKPRREIFKDLAIEKGGGTHQPVQERLYSPIESAARITRRQYWNDIEHLYDMIPIVWGLEAAEFECLLGVGPGWLDAYRVHEVKPGDETWERLCELLQVHTAMRMIVKPYGYRDWLRRPWTSTSPIGATSPLTFMLKGGPAAVKRVEQILVSQTL